MNLLNWHKTSKKNFQLFFKYLMHISCLLDKNCTKWQGGINTSPFTFIVIICDKYLNKHIKMNLNFCENEPKKGLWKFQIAILVLNQSPISAVFPIVRFTGDQKTALTRESLHVPKYLKALLLISLYQFFEVLSFKYSS